MSESQSVTVFPAFIQHQHHKLWFPDGDLVLSAPVSSQMQRIYRIHRFIVTQNSPVLRELLEKNEKKTGDIDLELEYHADLIDTLLTFLYNPLFVSSHYL
jgi:BTB/POZ domain